MDFIKYKYLPEPEVISSEFKTEIVSLPEPVLVKIFSMSKSLLNLSLVCVQFNEIIAASPTLMKAILKKWILGFADGQHSISKRQYEKLHIFVTPDARRYSYEFLIDFPESLKCIEVFGNEKRPLRSLMNVSNAKTLKEWYTWRAQNATQNIANEDETSNIFPIRAKQIRLKKLIIHKTPNLKILNHLENVEHLIIKETSELDDDSLQGFLAEQKNLKVLDLDIMSSFAMFQRVSKIYTYKKFILLQYFLFYFRSTPISST